MDQQWMMFYMAIITYMDATLADSWCFQCETSDCDIVVCTYSNDCHIIYQCNYLYCFGSLSCVQGQIYEPGARRCVDEATFPHKCQKSTAYLTCKNSPTTRICAINASIPATATTTATILNHAMLDSPTASFPVDLKHTPSRSSSPVDLLTVRPVGTAAVVAGNSCTFTCTFCPQARHNFESFTWFLRGKTLRNSTRLRMTNRRRDARGCTIEDLVFSPVARRDSGILNCSVQYNVNFVYNASLTMEVRRLPRVEIDNLTVTAYKSSPAIRPITCYVSVELKDTVNRSLTSRWYSDGILLRQDDISDVNKSFAWWHSIIYTAGDSQMIETRVRYKSQLYLDGNNAKSVYCEASLEGVGTVQSEVCTIVILDKTRPYELCPDDILNNVMWKMTLADSTDWRPCPREMSGFASRYCKANMLWSEVDIQTCTSNSLFTISYMISVWLEDATGVDESTLKLYLLRLSNAFESSAKTRSDVEMVANDLYMLSVMRRTNTIKNITIDEMTLMTRIVSNVTTSRQWSSVNSTASALQLLDAIEFYMQVWVIGENIMSADDNSLHIHQTNTIEIKSLLLVNKTENDKVVLLDEDKKQITFPWTTINQINSILGSQVAFGSVASTRHLERQMTNAQNWTIVSSIVSVSVFNWTSDVTFVQPVQIVFDHVVELKADDKPVCAYWRNYGGFKGAWAFDGCQILASASNLSFTTCVCYHLTNFAILLSPSFIDGNNYTILSIISLIGCAVSIGALVLTIFIYSLRWRKIGRKKKQRIVVVINLCVALIVANSLFIAGVNRTNQPIVCLVVAALLHYFFLCAFFVMFVLAVIHYITVCDPLNPLRRRQLIGLLFFAWFAPALIVGVSMAVTKTVGYGGSANCWLSVETGLLWAFAGPALTVVFVNAVLMAVILSKMYCCRQEVRSTQEKTKPSKVVLNLIVFNVLFGTTWVFGVLSVNEDLVVFQYVFACVNSFQGLWIFVTEILLQMLDSKKKVKTVKGPIAGAAKGQSAPKSSSQEVNQTNQNGVVQHPEDDLQRQYPDMRDIEEITIHASRLVSNQNSIDSNATVSTTSGGSFVNQSFKED